MTMYRAEFASTAARKVRRLDRPARARLLDVIELLVHSPRLDGVKKLTGAENAWRIRVGNYRTVYSIKDDVLVMTVTCVAYHYGIYRS